MRVYKNRAILQFIDDWIINYEFTFDMKYQFTIADHYKIKNTLFVYEVNTFIDAIEFVMMDVEEKTEYVFEKRINENTNL